MKGEDRRYDCKNNPSVRQCLCGGSDSWGSAWKTGGESGDRAEALFTWPPHIWLGPCPQHFWDGWVRKVWRRGDGIGEALTEMLCERANSSSLDTKKPFCYQSLEGERQSEESLFTAHTRIRLDRTCGPLKPRRGRRSVWGELLKLICSEVKLCEWFVLHNLWSVTCQPQMDSSRNVSVKFLKNKFKFKTWIFVVVFKW